jgi:AbrB family looped-hinge helix DNA binding protein
MRTTIDGAGRLVIPKPLRDRLGIDGGSEVEVFEHTGHLEIHRPERQMRLVKTPRGNLTISPGIGIGPEEVRIMIERDRERHG